MHFEYAEGDYASHVGDGEMGRVAMPGAFLDGFYAEPPRSLDCPNPACESTRGWDELPLLWDAGVRNGVMVAGRVHRRRRPPEDVRVKVVTEIRAVRPGARCGLSVRRSPSLGELAAEFGLAADAVLYHEIDADVAHRLAALVLREDLAYNAEILPATRAAELAGRFLAGFGVAGVRFYTNGTFGDPPRPGVGGSRSWSWNPVTGATFDTGVLILGTTRSGCLWVEDED